MRWLARGTYHSRPMLFRFGVIFGVWTAVVLAVAINCYLHGALGSEEGASFLQSLYWAAPTWYGWAALTPMVLWLARRLRLSAANWPWRTLALLGFGLAVSAAEMAIETALVVFSGGEHRLGAAGWTELGLFVLRRGPVHLGVYGAVILCWYLGEYYRRYRARELRTAQLETQLAVADLRALKLQLHPHFVLNALNTTAAMISRDPERAEEMVVRIGELLRMALDTREAHLVPLAEEIEFLEKYLEIERVRFGDQLEVRVEVAPALGEALVPSFVLQPFVENAIKHRRMVPGEPTRVEIRAWQEDSRLCLRVADNGSGWPAAEGETGSGLGIANTRARLDALFGARYTLAFSAASPSGLVVDLSLPHQTGKALERGSAA